MRIGKLRHRLTFQEPVAYENEIGESVSDWEDVFTVWGSVEPLSGRLYFEARQSTSEATGKITIRYRHVEPYWRILFYEGQADYEQGTPKTFLIVSIIQPEHRRKETQILYKELLD